ARRRDKTAVHQLRIVVNAYESAPRSGADKLPDFVLLEHPRQRITTGPGHFIDDHGLRSIDLPERRAKLLTFAADGAVAQRTFEQIDNVIRNEAAVVVAFVDHSAFFADLTTVHT